jgi:hypothetical protein
MRTCNTVTLGCGRNAAISVTEQLCEIGRKTRGKDVELGGGLAPAGLPQFLHFAREVHAGALDAVPVGVVDTPDDLAAAFLLHVPAARVGAEDREASSLTTMFESTCVHRR